MSFLAARPLCKSQMSSSRLGLCSAFYGKYLPANPMKWNLNIDILYVWYHINILIIEWKLICTKYHMYIHVRIYPMEIYLIKTSIVVLAVKWRCFRVNLTWLTTGWIDSWLSNHYLEFWLYMTPSQCSWFKPLLPLLMNYQWYPWFSWNAVQ